jgi:homocysteine S-methyltransferase
VRNNFVHQHPGRRRRLVAGSIGPYGASLCNGAEYTGAYKLSELELEAFHIERWQVLASTAVDFLACETVPNFTEVKALARLIFLTPHRWATMSLVCADPMHLADGTPLKEVLRAVNHLSNLAAIGINCIAPYMVPEALKELKRYASAPLMIYANGSNSWNLMSRQCKDLVGPEAFALEAQLWVQSGAQIIGGCCKTTPEHISRIAELEQFQTSHLVLA